MKKQSSYSLENPTSIDTEQLAKTTASIELITLQHQLELDLIRGDKSEECFKCVRCKKVPVAPIMECKECEEIYCGLCM